MTGSVIYSRNWRAKINGKGMSVVWDSKISALSLSVILQGMFCTENVEVYQ